LGGLQKFFFSEYNTMQQHDVIWNQSIKYNFNWRTKVKGYKIAELNDSIVVYSLIEKKSLKIIKVLYKIGNQKEIQKIINTIQFNEFSFILIDTSQTYLKRIFTKKSSTYDFSYLLFDKSIEVNKFNNLNLGLGDLDKIF
jgi:hypothetical protein